MSHEAAVQQPVQKLDPVWDRIRSESEEAARNDPSLGGFLFAAVLNHDSFESALCHRLAQRLRNADLGTGLVLQAFEDALEAEPEIGIAARADIIAVYDRDPACHRFIEPLFYFKGFQALQTHRMAHRLWHLGHRDFQIGPSHFMKKDLDEISLQRIWDYSVFPLIEEQFYNDPARVKLYRYEVAKSRLNKVGARASVSDVIESGDENAQGAIGT